MKVMIKKLLLMVILFSVLCGGIGISVPKQASAKTASKVTKVFTLTSKKKLIKHKLSISKKEKVFVKTIFLDVKGKAVEDENYWGVYDFLVKEKNKMLDGGKGSLWARYTKPKLKNSSFKKGKCLGASKNDDGLVYISGNALVEWELPRGITKLKAKVTYYTQSGKKGIKSVK